MVLALVVGVGDGVTRRALGDDHGQDLSSINAKKKEIVKNTHAKTKKLGIG
jgi:hypothetical protein